MTSTTTPPRPVVSSRRRLTTAMAGVTLSAALLAASCGSSNDSAASTTTQIASTTTIEDPTTTVVEAPANDDSGDDDAYVFPGAAGTLELTSSAMAEGGEMPTTYTCDGEAATPPLEWSNAPADTVGYAIVMHHVAGPGDTHWYWELWNIPSDVTSIESNGTTPGDVGINSVNERNEYAPPCSQGPGTKSYTFTVYALSAQPDLVDPSVVTRAVLLDSLEGLVLDAAELNVTYTRDSAGDQP